MAPAPPEFRIEQVSAARPQAIEAARGVFREYATSLAIDLEFQGFEAELAGLPGDYAEPAGVLMLAWQGDAVAGCGALRPLPDCDVPNACEMKRLYVRPAFRRFGLGRVLVQVLLDHATAAGYASVLLDTLDDMEAARSLYRELGFREVAPYYYNPVVGAHYLRADLGAMA